MPKGLYQAVLLADAIQHQFRGQRPEERVWRLTVRAVDYQDAMLSRALDQWQKLGDYILFRTLRLAFNRVVSPHVDQDQDQL